jgi:GNAT superfamily N-acetyltransferase
MKLMKLQVRPATEGDATAACDVIRSSILECCGEDHRGDAAVLEEWLRNKTPEFVRRVILAPTAFSFVATLDRETVGFASAVKNGVVTLCYVAPVVRFTGVGKALLAAIEDRSAREGVASLSLESTRTARSFYARNGFIPEGPPILASSWPIAARTPATSSKTWRTLCARLESIWVLSSWRLVRRIPVGCGSTPLSA